MTITLLLYYYYLLTKYKISSSGSHSVDISFVRFVVSQPYLVECVPQPRTLPRGPELCNTSRNPSNPKDWCQDFWPFGGRIRFLPQSLPVKIIITYLIAFLTTLGSPNFGH